MTKDLTATSLDQNVIIKKKKIYSHPQAGFTNVLKRKGKEGERLWASVLYHFICYMFISHFHPLCPQFILPVSGLLLIFTCSDLMSVTSWYFTCCHVHPYAPLVLTHHSTSVVFQYFMLTSVILTTIMCTYHYLLSLLPLSCSQSISSLHSISQFTEHQVSHVL